MANIFAEPRYRDRVIPMQLRILRLKEKNLWSFFAIQDTQEFLSLGKYSKARKPSGIKGPFTLTGGWVDGHFSSNHRFQNQYHQFGHVQATSDIGKGSEVFAPM